MNIFFKLLNMALGYFWGVGANVSRSIPVPLNIIKQTYHPLKHGHPCEYPTEIFLGRNYECALREINVTNAIDLEVEVNDIHNL